MYSTRIARLIGLSQRWGMGIGDWFSRPASARPLAFWRVGVAAIMLAQAWACSASMFDVYGSQGIVNWDLTEAILVPGVPRISWITETLAPLGLGEGECIRGLFAVHMVALLGLLLGWRTRWMAIPAWLTHLMLKSSSRLMAYGVDEFQTISLFYFVWMPVGAAWSLDALAGRVSTAPSPLARLSLRVLQLHLCLVYFTSGWVKASGEEWQTGEAIWYALMRPDFTFVDFSWLASAPWIALLACWATLAVELGYAFLVWSRWTRKPIAFATIGMHLGILLFMGLWSFAALMIVLTASAYLVPVEPRTAPLAEECEPANNVSCGPVSGAVGASA